MSTEHKSQPVIDAQQGLALLQAGNLRFLQGVRQSYDVCQQVKQTASGQAPFAIVLGCMDSRVPPEMIFDQNLGALFTLRVAGNVINRDIAASVEYGCYTLGVPLLVIMGHTGCGAVQAACESVKIGNITSLLDKIKPSVERVKAHHADFGAQHYDEVAYENVHHSAHELKNQSTILGDLQSNQSLQVTGAMYHVATGSVDFFPVD